MKVDSALEEHYEEMGDNHASSAEGTPLREEGHTLLIYLMAQWLDYLK